MSQKPEVRFLKLFRGNVTYDDILELEQKPSIETIRALSFPHTEHGLRILALVKIPASFFGEISARIPELKMEFDAAGVRAPDEVTWMTYNLEIPKVVFPNSGSFTVEITVLTPSTKEKPIHSIKLQVKQ